MEEYQREVLSANLRIKVAPSVMDRMDALADEVGLNRSEIIRVALNLLLKVRSKMSHEQIRQMLY